MPAGASSLHHAWIDGATPRRHRAGVTDAEPTLRADEPRANGLGVVDPLRIPGVDRIRGGWGRLPALGRVFVALALVDVVIRAFNVGGLSLFFDPSSPATFLFFALPHLALVLLPAVLLARRPDALVATPLIVWGAVALALVELLSEPLFTVLVPGTDADLTGWALLQVVAVFARAGGYVGIAMGLVALATFEPRPALRGLANVVAGVFVGAAVTVVLLSVVLPPTDFGVPGMGGLTLLVGAVGELATIGFAGLAWAILRGTADARRPVEARYLAFGAIILAATNAFLTLGVNVAGLVQVLLGAPLTAATTFGLGFLGTGLVLTLLVVAFGLGLADTSVRIPRRGAYSPIAPGPAPEPVNWPSPGGDVPAFRPVERPVEATGARPATGAGFAKGARPQRRGSTKKEQPG
jgi:hypothetical protein